MAEVKVALRTAAAWTANQAAMEALYGVGNYYTTIDAWESTEQTNLVTDTDTHVLEVYDDWAGGSPLNPTGNTFVSGWGCNNTYFITIRAATGNEYDIATGDGAFFSTSSTNTYNFTVDDEIKLNLESLGFTNSGSTKSNPIIFYQYGSNAVYNSVLTNVHVFNCGRGGFKSGDTGDTDKTLLRQCTFSQAATTASSCVAFENVDTENCAAYTSVSGSPTSVWYGYHQNTVIVNVDSAYNNFYTGFTGDYCSSNDTSAPGANSLDNQGLTDIDWVDAANGDFHIEATSSLIGAGVNLYSDFTDDIDGDEWPSSGAFDIGVDHYVAAASAPTLSSPGVTSVLSDRATPQVTLTF